MSGAGGWIELTRTGLVHCDELQFVNIFFANKVVRNFCGVVVVVVVVVVVFKLFFLLKGFR